MKSRFFLNILVTQTTAIFQLFPVKDKTLLVWRDSFCLEFLLSPPQWCLLVPLPKKIPSFQRMFLERFACHYKVLQPSEESISLNIVVTQTITIFQLLSVKDRTDLEGFLLCLEIFSFTTSMGSAGLTSRVALFPANVFTKICILLRTVKIN